MKEEKKIEYNWFTESAKKLAKQLYLPSYCNKKPIKQIKNGIIYENTNYYHPLKLDFQENPSHYDLNLKKSIKNFNSKINKSIKKDKPTNTSLNLIKVLNNKFKKDLKNCDKIIKTLKYELDFTMEQKNILNIWFEECNKVYNKCVELYNKTPKFNLNYKKSKLDIFKILYEGNKKSAPYAILTDEVRLFCSNVKSCLTNLVNNNIKYYTMTERNIKNQQSMYISKDVISKKGIYTTILGGIKKFNKINTDNIATDCRLLYDRVLNKYYLCIPEYHEMKIVEHRKPIVALDPGEKNFMGYYSLSEYGKIGIEMRKPILKLRSKISKYQKALKKKTNKNKTTLKNKLKLKRKIQKKYNKIKNIVKELHNQTSNYLCKNYDKIILPEFGTSKMVCNKEERTKKIKENIDKIKEESQSNEEIKEKIKNYRRKRLLNKKTKYVLNNLAHYKFKQHILNKAQEYGCQIVIVTEEYTSQACGFCGELSEKYTNRIKHCEKCNHKIDRDINGARNILIKNHAEVIKQ